MRTATAGGICPCSRKRRTLAYEARSTSMAKVERGEASASRKPFSATCPYSSVPKLGAGASTALSEVYAPPMGDSAVVSAVPSPSLPPVAQAPSGRIARAARRRVLRGIIMVPPGDEWQCGAGEPRTAGAFQKALCIPEERSGGMIV